MRRLRSSQPKQIPKQVPDHTICGKTLKMTPSNRKAPKMTPSDRKAPKIALDEYLISRIALSRFQMWILAQYSNSTGTIAIFEKTARIVSTKVLSCQQNRICSLPISCAGCSRHFTQRGKSKRKQQLRLPHEVT